MWEDPSQRFTMKGVYEWLSDRRASVLGVSVGELEKQITSSAEKGININLKTAKE